MNKFSDGTSEGYAELPVEFAWLNWTRGNAKLAQIKDTDPGAYFGGWRAFVNGIDRSTKEEYENPKLPLPVVQRVSEDGKHPYQVYATNVIEFLPIQHRTRFELREQTTDPESGRSYNKLVATSPQRKPGYAPCRQIFGLVYNGEEYAPAVMVINKWSAFISFEKAGQKWNKIKIPDTKVLVRRYGSVGNKDSKGNVTPNFEVFGQGRSTPIDAVGLDKPKFVELTKEMDELYEGSTAWKNCSMWNAEGEVEEEREQTDLEKFLEICDIIGLSEGEIAQIVKENAGDYHKALLAVNTDEYAINAAFEESDNPQ